MATITIPEKSRGMAADSETSQKRPGLERYRLQVDRQTKSSFQNLAEAEKVGADIKKKFPAVQIAIYDAVKGETKIM